MTNDSELKTLLDNLDGIVKELETGISRIYDFEAKKDQGMFKTEMSLLKTRYGLDNKKTERELFAYDADPREIPINVKRLNLPITFDWEGDTQSFFVDEERLQAAHQVTAIDSEKLARKKKEQGEAIDKDREKLRRLASALTTHYQTELFKYSPREISEKITTMGFVSLEKDIRERRIKIDEATATKKLTLINEAIDEYEKRKKGVEEFVKKEQEINEAIGNMKKVGDSVIAEREKFTTKKDTAGLKSRMKTLFKGEKADLKQEVKMSEKFKLLKTTVDAIQGRYLKTEEITPEKAFTDMLDTELQVLREERTSLEEQIKVEKRFEELKAEFAVRGDFSRYEHTKTFTDFDPDKPGSQHLAPLVRAHNSIVTELYNNLVEMDKKLEAFFKEAPKDIRQNERIEALTQARTLDFERLKKLADNKDKLLAGDLRYFDNLDEKLLEGKTSYVGELKVFLAGLAGRSLIEENKKTTLKLPVKFGKPPGNMDKHSYQQAVLIHGYVSFAAGKFLLKLQPSILDPSISNIGEVLECGGKIEELKKLNESLSLLKQSIDAGGKQKIDQALSQVFSNVKTMELGEELGENLEVFTHANEWHEEKKESMASEIGDLQGALESRGARTDNAWNEGVFLDSKKLGKELNKLLKNVDSQIDYLIIKCMNKESKHLQDDLDKFHAAIETRRALYKNMKNYYDKANKESYDDFKKYLKTKISPNVKDIRDKRIIERPRFLIRLLDRIGKLLGIRASRERLKREKAIEKAEETLKEISSKPGLKPK